MQFINIQQAKQNFYTDPSHKFHKNKFGTYFKNLLTLLFYLFLVNFCRNLNGSVTMFLLNPEKTLSWQLLEYGVATSNCV